MPIRYHCQAYEANEPCRRAVCMHAHEFHEGERIETQYLFGTYTERQLFATLPEVVQQLVLMLADAGYDPRMFDIDE